MLADHGEDFLLLLRRHWRVVVQGHRVAAFAGGLRLEIALVGLHGRERHVGLDHGHVSVAFGGLIDFNAENLCGCSSNKVAIKPIIMRPSI